MESGKGDAKDDCPQGEGSEDLPDSLKSKPFRNSGREFNKQRDHVKQKVPRDKEENRVHPELVPKDGVDDVPPSTQIQQDGPRIKNIGEEPIQDRCPYQRMVFFGTQDIDNKGKDISPSCKGDPYHHIKSNPYPPRKVL